MAKCPIAHKKGPTVISIVSKNPSKKHLLQQFINYKDIVLPRDTRQKAVPSKCSCYICLVGSDKTRKPTYQKKQN